MSAFMGATPTPTRSYHYVFQQELALPLVGDVHKALCYEVLG
jgi:hypothetical protein